MTGRKFIITKLFISLLIISNINAQSNFELMLRTNLGVGTEYKSLEFSNANNSGNLLFSPGGGFGAEIGLGYLLVKNVSAYTALGYQQNLALQYYSSTNGGTDKTSFSFSRGSIFVGVNYRFNFNEDSKFGLQFGGGGNYNIPGKMKITELNFDYGDVSFYPNLGFHLETGLSYRFKKWTMLGAIRYRQLSFKLKDYRQPLNSSLTTDSYMHFPDYIKNINSAGIDFSLSFIKSLKND